MRSDVPKGLHDREDLPRAELCVAPNAAPPLGTAGRSLLMPATTALRPLISVELLDYNLGEFHVTDRYVRRYWTALLGPSAVADLLRMVAAAEKSVRIRRPHALSRLLTERLVIRTAHGYAVASRIGPLPDHRLQRLPRFLRAELRSINVAQACAAETVTRH